MSGVFITVNSLNRSDVWFCLNLVYLVFWWLMLTPELFLALAAVFKSTQMACV